MDGAIWGSAVNTPVLAKVLGVYMSAGDDYCQVASTYPWLNWGVMVYNFQSVVGRLRDLCEATFAVKQ